MIKPNVTEGSILEIKTSFLGPLDLELSLITPTVDSTFP
jgi:hypothetical protein